MILLYTVLIGIGISSTFSVRQVEQLLDKYSKYNLAGWWHEYLEHQHELIEALRSKTAATYEAKGQIELVEQSRHI